MANLLPTPNDLIGKHRVTILTGNLPDMSKLGHIKIIKSKKDKLVGHNRTCFIPWGWFDIFYCGEYVLFEYRNLQFFDKVIKVADGILEGTYIASAFGDTNELVGTFRMDKV